MERRLKMLISMFYLAVVGFRQSSGARLLGSDIFVVGLRNPCMLYSYLNGGAGLLFSAEESSVRSDEKLKVWGDKTKESPPAADIVLNVAAKGSVTPPGNSMVDTQQLGIVGDMHIYSSLPKSPPLSSWERRQQKRVSKKRILQSTPSPGGGN